MAATDYALITGASSGIGECLARALAARQRNLVLVARSKAKLETLAAEFRAAHKVLAEVVDCDLSVAGASARLAALLGERKLEIDLLVNNAGFGAHGEFWKLPLDRQAEMLRLNVQAVVELTHLLVARMVERRAGAIINVSSTASFQALPYTLVYGGTKAFVTSFSMGLAEELRPYGVRVVTLCPGGTATNFFSAGGYRRPEMFPSLQPVEEVVEAALGALERGGGVVVPGLANKLGVALQRFVPRAWPVKIAARMFRV